MGQQTAQSTTDRQTAIRWMLRDLRTPFGGMKQSGLGREGGLEAMRFFTEPKNVGIALQ